MFRYKCLLILAVSCVTLVSVRADSYSTHSFPSVFSDGSMATFSVSISPATSNFQPTDLDADRVVWSNAEYALGLTAQEAGGTTLLTFDLQRYDGKPFTLRGYGMQASVAAACQDGIWSYNDLPWADFVNTHLESPLLLNTAANNGIPFVVLVDHQGMNKLALGLLKQDLSVQLTGNLSADSTAYIMSTQAQESITTSRYTDTFYISRAGRNWYHEAENYTTVVDGARNYSPLTIPDSVFNPTYDSWYFTGDGIDQQLVLDLAKRSQQLGFRSYLLDAGWDTTPGQYSLGIDGSTGDYVPDQLYFPDFGSLLSEIKSRLGMRVMLWMQQYALGRKSMYYPQLEGALYHVLDPQSNVPQEDPALCPRVAETRRHLTDLFERVMNDYQPDALWFDWQDQIPTECNNSHPHDIALFGEAYNLAQQMVRDVIYKHNPDAFVEKRWPFANLNNKPYTQLWQPLDSAGKFEDMRLQAMRMRPFSKGVSMGTDEMYWSPAIPDSEAARFMATVVFTGVPYFGPNLFEESGQRLQMLRAWLQFYETNRNDLTQGAFEPYGDLTHPDQKIVSPNKTFIYYGNRYWGPVDAGWPENAIFVANASSSDGVDLTLSKLRPGWYGAQISDLLLNADKTFPPQFFDSNATVHYDVPVGCMLTLSRVIPERQARSSSK